MSIGILATIQERRHPSTTIIGTNYVLQFRIIVGHLLLHATAAIRMIPTSTTIIEGTSNRRKIIL
jgi:hypothetical protein